MYSYFVCFCRECTKMDLTRRCSYDNNMAYCTERSQYYNPNSKACEKYFEYDEVRNPISSGCYLTTIVCNVLNLDDNCQYLNVLRKFRDSYMKNQESLLPILLEYDVIGPILSNYIEKDPCNLKICQSILKNYIIPITNLIQLKEYDGAITKYKELVNNLKTFYSLSIQLKSNLDYSQITGKGYLLKK